MNDGPNLGDGLPSELVDRRESSTARPGHAASQTRLAPPPTDEPTFAPPGSSVFPDPGSTADHGVLIQGHVGLNATRTADVVAQHHKRGFFGRLFDVAQQWRVILAIWLAALFSVTVVGSYLLSVQPTGSQVASGPQSRSVFESITEFGDNANSETVSEDPAVDDQAATLWTEQARPESSDRLSGLTSQTPSTSSSASPETTANVTSTQTTATSPIAPTNPSPSPGPSSTSTTDGIESAITAEGVDRVEVEYVSALGATQDGDKHGGYSGTGYVTNMTAKGSGIAFYARRNRAGTVPITIRYSASSKVGPATARTMSVSVGDSTVAQASMALTKDWNTWKTVAGEIDLEKGLNKIVVIVGPDDTGWVNIDYIEIG